MTYTANTNSTEIAQRFIERLASELFNIEPPNVNVSITGSIDGGGVEIQIAFKDPEMKTFELLKGMKGLTGGQVYTNEKTVPVSALQLAAAALLRKLDAIEQHLLPYYFAGPHPNWTVEYNAVKDALTKCSSGERK